MADDTMEEVKEKVEEEKVQKVEDLERLKVRNVEELIKDRGLDAEIIWHLGRTGETTEDALSVHKIPPSSLLKCLLLIDKQHKPMIAMLTGDKRIDFNRLEKLSELKKLRLASQEEMKEIMGRGQGEVAPIGLPERIPAFIDKDMMKQEFVIGSAGSKFAGLKINPKEILKCTNARIEDIGMNIRDVDIEDVEYVEDAGKNVGKDFESVETRTHTALHVLKGAVQKVLGAKLTTGVYVNGADGRLSVRFDRKPTEEEVARIENEANGCVKQNKEIKILEMDRAKAEQRFGDSIYDAFPVPERITKLKIASIEGWNINCCIEKHTKTTGEVGQIKIDDLRFRNNKQLLEISFKVI